MRYVVFLLSFFIALTIPACVSKKKYDRQVELASGYQDMYNSLKHDSLLMSRRIDSLVKDSLETHRKLEEVLAKSKSGNSEPPKYYKPSTMTKEREQKLKTIFLYNIANGIEWDTKYSKGKFTIGVLGKSGITAVMIKELANKKKGFQDFAIVEYEKVTDIGSCHILLVTKGNYKSMGLIKAKVRDYPTLLVSEEDYKSLGAHFNLAVDGDGLKMNANRDLLKKNGFNVSKSLLNDAD